MNQRDNSEAVLHHDNNSIPNPRLDVCTSTSLSREYEARTIDTDGDGPLSEVCVHMFSFVSFLFSPFSHSTNISPDCNSKTELDL